MSELWELWLEIVQDSQSLKDPVLLECFAGGESHKVFDQVGHDGLKAVLSKVKGLLNEPRTRDKGASVFNEFNKCVEVRRLVGLQDAVVSVLRLLCNDKCLQSHIVQETLANFLPKCKQLPDVLKELTPKNAYVSKIVYACVEGIQRQDQPNPELLRLLRICLQNFRGTCGAYRDKLEKLLLPFLDHEHHQMVKLICNLLPLLSQSGGGGTKGDNHSKDWKNMVQELMKEANTCLNAVYSECAVEDISQDDNNTGGSSSEQFLSPITDNNVLIRISKIKRRLTNLVDAVGAYLRKSFPSPKPVPAKNIIRLIEYMLFMNPEELLEKSQPQPRKEVLFLATLIPSIHQSAFGLLRNLINCLGTNLLPESVSIEQFFTQEWRWLDKKAQKTSFSDLKNSIYTSLHLWLKTTKGQVSASKTTDAWVEHFLRDIQLERDVVELKMLSGKNKSKKELRNIAPVTNGTGDDMWIQKDCTVCTHALDALMNILPFVDSAAAHKATYCTLVKTHTQVYQEGTFPNQYVTPSSRAKLQRALVELAVNPNAKSGISLSLILNLIRRGSLDPCKEVRTSCITAMSILERIFHPTSHSLDFSCGQLGDNDETSASSNAERSNVILSNLSTNSSSLMETEEVDGNYPLTVDSECQTEFSEINGDDESEPDAPERRTIDLELAIEIRRELKALREGINTYCHNTPYSNVSQFQNAVETTTRPMLTTGSFSPSIKRRREDDNNTHNDVQAVPANANRGEHVEKGSQALASTGPRPPYDIETEVEQSVNNTNSESESKKIEGEFSSNELREMFNDFVDEGNF